MVAIGRRCQSYTRMFNASSKYKTLSMSVNPFNVYVARESLVGALRKQPKLLSSPVSAQSQLLAFAAAPGSLSSPARGEIFIVFHCSVSVPEQSRRTFLFDWSEPTKRRTARPVYYQEPPTCTWQDDRLEQGLCRERTRRFYSRRDACEGQHPVHAHCSAGVRRSGGFTTIDASAARCRSTRRARVISHAASEFQAHSNVSNEYRRSSRVLNKAPPDAMDVDPPSPHNGPTTKDSTQLTVPVSVGHCEVDVPVAGFTPKFMDIDARSRRLQSPHATAPVRRGSAPNITGFARTREGGPSRGDGRVADCLPRTSCRILPDRSQRLHVFEWWQQRRLRGSEQWERANLPVLRPSSPAMSALDGTPEFRHRKDGEVSPNEWHSPSPPAVLTAAAGTSSPAPVLLCQRQNPRMAFQTSDGRPSSDGTMRVAEASPPPHDARKLHSDSSPSLLLTALRWFKSTRRSGAAGEAPRTRIRVHILSGTVSSSPLDTAAAHRPSPLNANLGTHNPTRSLHLPASPFVPHASGSDHPMSPACVLLKTRSVSEMQSGDLASDAGASRGRQRQKEEDEVCRRKTRSMVRPKAVRCQHPRRPPHSRPVSTTVIDARAGAPLTAEWHHALNQAAGDPADPIDSSHKGPLTSYLYCQDPGSNPVGLKWFKIAEEGLDPDGTWATDVMIANAGKCIEDGQYLRHKRVIAEHQGRSGAKTPSTVSFPGACQSVELIRHFPRAFAGITISIYYPTVKNYTIPGPALFTC
ncbi:uncharacterized protein BXZ73DRAFT_76580 [Epithele typhae]|uniref:uncharacterized protein n=1 Tax=Epithele typhae TaxID=378194 RepID=UPI00200780EA|nr:uncharacterized protein BXZ73DRAFT_76580 [Epithele typhae]KAH9936758.1 hypothetical protein BXZ73DRAFT_76580 [Epithele typhae]